MDRAEEEQLEAIKKLWRENGTSIVVGVVIGATAIFGWRGWQTYQVEHASTASDSYQKMIVADKSDKTEEAKDHAISILEQYKSTAYAGYAALFLAKYAVADNDYLTARENLNWVISNTSQVQVEHIARLRLARVLVAEDKLNEALDLLNLVSDTGEFATSYHELKGDIFLLHGNLSAAREEYNAAQAEKENTAVDMKLGDLGG